MLVIIIAFVGTPMLSPSQAFHDGGDQRGSIALAIGGYLLATCYALLRDRAVGRYLLRVGTALTIPIAVMFIGPSVAQNEFNSYEIGIHGYFDPLLILAGLTIIAALIIDLMTPRLENARSDAAATAGVWVTRFLGITAFYMGVLAVVPILNSDGYQSDELRFIVKSTTTYAPGAAAVLLLGFGIALLTMSLAIRRCRPGARTGALWIAGAFAAFVVFDFGSVIILDYVDEGITPFLNTLNGPGLSLVACVAGLFVLFLCSDSRSIFVSIKPPYLPSAQGQTAANPLTVSQGSVGGASPQRTSGMAIAALVCGILGVSAVAIILGFVARSQIRRSGGVERGGGMALAGIVLGFVWLALSLIFTITLLVLAHSVSSS